MTTDTDDLAGIKVPVRKMKEYAAGGSVWLYPPLHMPPPGQKLHILQRGKTACHGVWQWGVGFIAWQELPKQDREQEELFEQWIKEQGWAI